MPTSLLLTNVMMPLMNGLTLAENVRRHRPEIKIIVMSGQMDSEIRQGNNLDAFLQKPFVPSTLLTLIEKMLDKARREEILETGVSQY